LEIGEILGEEYAPLLYQFKFGYNIDTIKQCNFFTECGGECFKYLKVDNHIAPFLIFSIL